MIPKLAQLLLLKSIRGWVKYGGQISYPLECDNQWNFDKLATCPGCPGILYRQTPTTLSAGKKKQYTRWISTGTISHQPQEESEE